MVIIVLLELVFCLLFEADELVECVEIESPERLDSVTATILVDTIPPLES